MLDVGRDVRRSCGDMHGGRTSKSLSSKPITTNLPHKCRIPAVKSEAIAPEIAEAQHLDIVNFTVTDLQSGILLGTARHSGFRP